MGNRRSLLVLIVLGACGGDGGSAIDAVVTDGITAQCTPRPGTVVGLQEVALGLDQPMLVAAAPNDTRLFIVEQTGAIHVIRSGVFLGEPYLDLGGATGVVQCCGEQGLLGMAFHPDFRNNGRFYVAYTARNGGDHVFGEFTADVAADTVDPARGHALRRSVQQPQRRHDRVRQRRDAVHRDRRRRQRR
jgi:glucose/arabinose dehydrogenase